MNIKNLVYSYDKYEKTKRNVLDSVSLDINDGDFLSIVGRTGSGKTTLAMHMNGLLKPISGDIQVDGKSIYDKGYDLVKLRYKVSIVFQYPEYQLFAEDVLSDVCFGAINKGLSKDEAIKKAKEVLELLNFDMDKLNISPFIVSGGEKRKVALAGVFVMEPEILILDEPQAGLDQLTKLALYKILQDMNAKGKTIVIITHNLEDAIEYSNKICVMDEGKVLKVGSPKEVFSDENVIEKAHIYVPENILISRYMHEKYKDYDIDKIKRKEIIEEIIRVKSIQ
ncbi:MAG: energy-coupling factor ABC transporter ATP-binding protein [Lachnospiraceae bacterium]|nr:energy-coupling factor ABC transporter ATP-binding protein [Lachnospiraceae bacterium]